MGKNNIIKMLLNKYGSSKKVNNLIVIVILGILSLLLLSFFGDDNKQVNNNINNPPAVETSAKSTKNQFEKQLKEELEEILGKIMGVGEVDVMVTLHSSVEVVLAQDTTSTNRQTREKDTQGGTRDIDENTQNNKIIISKDAPYVTKEIAPQIQGIIVVAKGADDPNIKMLLFEAVKTVLDLPAGKVKVFPKK